MHQATGSERCQFCAVTVPQSYDSHQSTSSGDSVSSVWQSMAVEPQQREQVPLDSTAAVHCHLVLDGVTPSIESISIFKSISL